MKKFDRESNVRIWEGTPKIVITCILAAFSLFCIYVTLFANFLEERRLTSFVGLIIIMGYLVFPAKKGQQRVNYLPWYDVVAMIIGAGAFFYYFTDAFNIIQQGSRFEWYQIIIAVLGMLSLAEVCRRSVGLPILIVAACFLAYALIWGLSNPTFFGKLNYAMRYLFYSKEGILSTPINVCSKFIVVFIIFGAFLERTGIADFFIQISNSVVGGFSGGPAKVAVVASALEGMVSGSSVANTVGSGAVTIPLMKRTGYRPEFAGAAEAAASTGGQIMPPIMGAAAFLMADYIGVGYSKVVLMAILPALLYFAGIFISVHLEAKKLGLRGLTREELPKLLPLLKQCYLLIPLVLLVYLVSSGSNSIQYAAAIAIVAAIVVSLFNKNNRITPKRPLEALAAGGQGTITVAAACGIAGVIAGTITMTGLANM
ncbi:MAG: TRAP transporter fused permease subunit, partial [Oscillospiraceae bacterium]|nr:TRAP transporter fused permease subunit [Oscillospiraceae bacterium]